LHGLVLPRPDRARIDTGVRQADTVTPFYDPLIAKIIVWGEDRTAAVSRLSRALADAAILGLATNLAFLARIAAHPEFRAGALDTGFIGRTYDALLPADAPPPDTVLAAAALLLLQQRRGAAARDAAVSADRHSPWAGTDGWRAGGGPAPQRLCFRCGEVKRTVEAARRGDMWQLAIEERVVTAALEPRGETGSMLIMDGLQTSVLVLAHQAEMAVSLAGDCWHLTELDPLAPPTGAEVSSGRLTAPMPGRVVQVLVTAGDAVRRGQPLMVVEAMKMEHTIAAPRDGAVAAVRFAAGDLVEEGAELVAMSPTLGEGGTG